MRKATFIWLLFLIFTFPALHVSGKDDSPVQIPSAVRTDLSGRARIAADGVYRIIYAAYGPENGRREFQDVLWCLGETIRKFVRTRKEESYEDSIYLLQKIFLDNGLPKAPATVIAIWVISGWQSPLYNNEGQLTRGDFSAYRVYYDRLCQLLKAEKVQQ